jgi:hypothetical protein
MQNVSTIEMKSCVKRITNTWVTTCICQTTQLNIPVTWLQEPQNSGDLDRLLGASKLAILYPFFLVHVKKRQGGDLSPTYEQCCGLYFNISTATVGPLAAWVQAAYYKKINWGFFHWSKTFRE